LWRISRQPLPSGLVSLLRIMAFVILDLIFFIIVAALWR
jgi:4-hydroxybenzoate polyprenyltransferase